MKRVGIFILFSFSTFISNANNSITRFYNDTTLINDSNFEEISEVVVIGKSHKKELQTSGMAVGVAEVQKIANQAVQSTEILNRLSGVKIRQDGGLGSEIKYSINGFSGDAVKIFINGTPAKNYGPSFSLQSIPPSLIERIEVYKGVVPAHLQEDALGGAIDIILKKKKINYLTTSYSYGSFNTHQWDLSGLYRLKNGLTFDVSSFYNYSDNNYKVWGKNIYFKDYKGNIIESNGEKVRRFNDAYSSFGGKISAGITDVKWANSLLLTGIFSKDYKEIQNGTTMAIVYGNRHSRRRSSILQADYLKKDLFAKGLSLKVHFLYSNIYRSNIDTVGTMYSWKGPITNPNGSYVTYNSGAEANSTRKTYAINIDNTFSAKSNLAYNFNKHNILEINYLYNYFLRNNSDKYLPDAQQLLNDTRDLNKQILSVNYKNIAFKNRLTTNIFFKNFNQKVVLNEPIYNTTTNLYEKQKYTQHKNATGYGAAFSYKLLKNLHLMANAEKAVRLPNERELFGNIANDIVASPTLKPEISLNYNLGVDYRFNINNHYFNINTYVFYRDTKDMIKEIFSAREEYSSYTNLQSIETKGIDADITYSHKNLFMSFNISKLSSLFNTKYDEKGHKYNYYRTQIPNEPSLKFNYNISYNISDFIQKNSNSQIYCNLGYVKEFLRNWQNVGSYNLKYIPTQYPIDLGFSYTFPDSKLILNLSVKNILNQQIYDNYGLQKQGRSIFCKVTYSIL